MENITKCFSEEHKEIDAISFCPECRIYMCNKCDNIHSSFFKNHKAYKTNKDKNEEIYSEYCKEKNHSIKLEYFCKDHNKLCCGLCIAKLNKKGEGQHKDCDVYYIEDVKEEKMDKLKENIKCLEELGKQFNESLENLKKIFQKIENDKENLKLEIQTVFTKIRNIINDREDELLSEIDNIYNSNYFNEDIIKKGEKLPKQIKISLEKGKLLEKEWNDNSNLYSCINDCINIENNIKNINIINESITKCKIKNHIKIKFGPKGELFDNFLEIIKSFGNIFYSNYSFRECPISIKEERKYEISGEQKNIFTKIGTSCYHCGAICDNELDKSVDEHRWKIKILKTYKKSIMIGVAPSDFDIYSPNPSTCGWYFYCNNLKLYSGPPFNYKNVSTNLSEVDHEIIVVMSMKNRSLKFIVNGEDKGDSYKDIPIDKPIYPAVLLYHTGDSIEISEC